MSELEYWNPRKIDQASTDAEGWRIILSNRRIGKTTYASNWIYERARREQRTCLVRTKKSEVFGCVQGYADMINKYHDEKYTAKMSNLYASLISTQGHEVARCFAIHTASDGRGGSLEADLLIQDEMIPEDRRYWSHDPYSDVLSIQLSQCNGEGYIYSFGNRVSSVNPYFAKMRIYAKPDRDITVWPGIATIEIARGYKCAVPSINPLAGARKAGNFDGMYTEEKDNLQDFIEKARQGQWAEWVLVYDGRTYRLCQEGEKCIWTNVGESKLRAYTIRMEDLAKGREMIPSKLLQDLRTEYQANRMRFADINTMFDVVSGLFTKSDTIHL